MTKKQFVTLIAKYPGVTVDAESEEDGTLILDAPAGKIFRSSGCHCMVAPFTNNGGQSWKGDAYAELAERLAIGLEVCGDEDCDVCQEAL